MTTAKRLTPTDKAAVLLLALGHDIAAEIMRELDPPELKRIVMALSKLGRLEQATVEGVLKEFQKLLNHPQRGGLSGGGETARRLLEAAEQARGEDLGIKLTDSSANLRNTLDGIETQKLVDHIQREHPQTIALILAHLDGKRSGEALKRLTPALQIEVIQRIATLDAVDPEMIAQLDESLRSSFDQSHISLVRSLGGTTQVAKMLASMDRSTAERYLNDLELKDPSLAEAVRAELFTFADLVRIDDAGMRILIAETPRKTLLLAMRQAPAAVRDKIFRNVSERARKTLEDDIEAQGKVQRHDVEQAQQAMAVRARQLEDEGKLIVHEGDDELV